VKVLQVAAVSVLLVLLAFAGSASAKVVATSFVSPAGPSFHMPDAGVDNDVNLAGRATIVNPKSVSDTVTL
jgi:hypothetical protein